MESHLNENFDLTSKNPTDEERWTSSIVAILKKMSKVHARHRKNEEKHRAAILAVKAEHSPMVTGIISKDEEGGGDEKDKGGGEKGGGDKGGGGSEKKDKGGGDKGGGGKGGGGSEKKDKPDDSEKKDKEGGGRAGEKKDRTSGELRKMGANKVYGGWFMYGPGTCAEAVVDEPKQEEWLLTGFAFIVSIWVTIHLCEWANRFSPSLVVVWF